jgi:hypothetical protein
LCNRISKEEIMKIQHSISFRNALFIFLSMAGLHEVAAGAPARWNPFGMQLRPFPSGVDGIRAPVIVREAPPSNEASIVSRRDGSLELYYITKPESDSVSMIRSTDSGFVWSDPVKLFSLPVDELSGLPGKAHYAVLAMEDDEGRMQVVFHVAGKGPGGYRGRLYEVYHTRQSADGLSWSAPQRVIPGYVGSIRTFQQMKNGRIILSAGKAAPERDAVPAFGPDYGWNDVVTFLSDDRGANWVQSPDILNFPLDAEFPTRYGAIEPAVVELADGRLWMLIRDRGGRFMESFSQGGEHWSKPEKSRFITSDSPATFLRLKDGRIILFFNACQNWSNSKSYARGGREVLHAAISSDNGVSWSGFREVLNETEISGTARGDKGTAYGTAAETRAGHVVLFSGQGEGKRFIVLFHPAWLLEDSLHDDLTAGPVFWTQYGGKGLRVEAAVDTGTAAVLLPLRPNEQSGAEWNFPALTEGKMKMQMLIPPDASAVSISLTDHFSRADDYKAAEHAVFHFPLLDRPGLVYGEWVDVELQWDVENSRIRIGDFPSESIPKGRVVEHGLNYLRVEAFSSGEETLKIRNLMVERILRINSAAASPESK